MIFAELELSLIEHILYAIPIKKQRHPKDMIEENNNEFSIPPLTPPNIIPRTGKNIAIA